MVNYGVLFLMFFSSALFADQLLGHEVGSNGDHLTAWFTSLGYDLLQEARRQESAGRTFVHECSAAELEKALHVQLVVVTEANRAMLKNTYGEIKDIRTVTDERTKLPLLLLDQRNLQDVYLSHRGGYRLALHAYLLAAGKDDTNYRLSAKATAGWGTTPVDGKEAATLAATRAGNANQPTICDHDLNLDEKKTPQGWRFGFSYQGVAVTGAIFEDVKHREAPFCDGLAGVKKDGQWGFIDKAGRTVIDFKYSEVTPFSQKVAGVRADAAWTLIDRQGFNLCGTQTYFFLGPANEGKLAARALDGDGRISVGYLDLQCHQIVEPQYQDGGVYHGGIAPVKKDGKWAFLSANGRETGEWLELRAMPIFDEGIWLLESAFGSDNDYTVGVANGAGKVLIRPETAGNIKVFDGEIIGVLSPTSGTSWAFYNVKLEKWITGFVYYDVEGFSEGLAAVHVKSGDRETLGWAYVDTDGNIVIPPHVPHFFKAGPFNHGVALIGTTEGETRLVDHFIDKSGNYLDP